ncbi:hypothetical protein MRX96_049620 [Rhipicephalus microplus]
MTIRMVSAKEYTLSRKVFSRSAPTQPHELMVNSASPNRKSSNSICVSSIPEISEAFQYVLLFPVPRIHEHPQCSPDEGIWPTNHRRRLRSSSGHRTCQCVWVRPDQVKATVLSPARRPRSNVVETEQGGVLQRNRRHLVPFVPPAPRVEPPPSEEQEPQRTLPPLEPQRTTIVQPPNSLGLPPPDSDRSDGVTPTRSGRRVVPPNRLKL